MVWLSADCDTPSFAAALVKLRSSPDGQEGQQVVEVFRAAFMAPAHKSMRIIVA